MTELYDFENENESKRKSVTVEDREFFITRKDPYGFLYVTLPQGRTPTGLDGVFTTEDHAIKAITLYLAQKKLEEQKTLENGNNPSHEFNGSGTTRA